MNTLSGLRGSSALSARLAAAMLALLLGGSLLFLTGFAAPTFLHNATHDVRHAFGLPCH